MLTFNLTEQQADIILNALAQRQYIEVQGVIQTLMQQVQAQQNQNRQAGLGAITGAAGAGRSLGAEESNTVGDELPKAQTQAAGQQLNGAAQS